MLRGSNEPTTWGAFHITFVQWVIYEVSEIRQSSVESGILRQCFEHWCTWTLVRVIFFHWFGCILRQAVIICMMECGNELLKFSFRQFLHRNSYGTAVENSNQKFSRQGMKTLWVFGSKPLWKRFVWMLRRKTEQNRPAERMRLIVYIIFFHIGLTEGEKKTNVN